MAARAAGKRRILPAAILIVALSGCTAASPDPTPTPTPTVVTDLADWHPEPRPDDRLGSACDHDPAASAPFGCTVYVSTAGSAAGIDMPWLATAQVKASFAPMNGSITLVMAMPCNVVNVPVDVTDSSLIPKPTANVSAMACAGPAGQADSWLLDVLDRPMTFTLDSSTPDGSTLVLRSGEDEITFEGTTTG